MTTRLSGEFLDGYYGTAAGPVIWRYLELLNAASRNYHLSCYSPPGAPFLHLKTLAEAETLWQDAEHAVAGNDELLACVRLGHLPVRYVWLTRWDDLRKECAAAQSKWPLPECAASGGCAVARVAGASPENPALKVTQINEGGLTTESFLSQFGQ